MSSPTQIFIAYSRKDSILMEKLRTHLRPLERVKMAKIWYDGIIEAGKDWEKEIKNHLHSADIILLLISADFIDSDYCYDDEMMDALKKEERNEAKVIPIILRPCAWSFSPFAKLQVLPKDGKPVIEHEDYAFTEIVETVAGICQQKTETPKSNKSIPDIQNSLSPKNKKTEEDIPFFETEEMKGTQAMVDSILSGDFSSKETTPQYENNFTDPRDGQIYKTVKLKNGKIWMAQNLNFDAGKQSYFYNDNPQNGENFGRLYTFDAAQDSCPKGWKIPSNQDWQELVDFNTPGGRPNVLGFNKIACKSLLQEGIKNFEAKLGGWRDEKNKFYNINEYGLYWTSDFYNDEYLCSWIFSPDSDLGTYGSEEKRNYALSVRCIKDE